MIQPHYFWKVLMFKVSPKLLGALQTVFRPENAGFLQHPYHLVLIGQLNIHSELSFAKLDPLIHPWIRGSNFATYQECVQPPVRVRSSSAKTKRKPKENQKKSKEHGLPFLQMYCFSRRINEALQLDPLIQNGRETGEITHYGYIMSNHATIFVAIHVTSNDGRKK